MHKASKSRLKFDAKMKQVLRFNKIIKIIITTGDLCLINLIFILLYHAFDYQTLGSGFVHSLPQLLVLLNLVYLACYYPSGIILNERIVHPERIVRRVFRNTFLHAFVFISLITLTDIGTTSARFFISFYALLFFILTIYRLVARYLLKRYRKGGGNTRSSILVGINDHMDELYQQMMGDPTTGYRIIGYFNDQPSSHFSTLLPYLGQPKEVVSYLQEHPTEQVYCCLPATRSSEILPVINYCENHFIRFYSVPDIRNYLHRRMHFEMFGSVPVLSIRQEPLSQLENQVLKRAFDLVFSGLILCTLFPLVYLIVGIAIKITSPGPIFFKQKRSGENGKVFWCYKFRSMHVNKESNQLQATQYDPRKTRLGNFLRKTNIDELPQFINVFLGQMSVVGPRPHMLKHTEEYSKQIDEYMVRHLIKPGITGWAQVTGYRGETKELWQMKGRVQRDVWYLEHWTFLLDMYIIYKTVKNGIIGDKEAY